MHHRTRCPICDSTSCASEFRVEYRSPFLADFMRDCPLREKLAGENYNVLRCARCRLYFQEVVADVHEAAAIYAGGAEIGAREPRPLPQLAHLAEDAIHIRLLFPDQRPVVLDFGMNRGDWPSMARSFGCDAWGTDIDDAAAQVAAARGVRFVRFDALEAQRFDFINADQVFEHLSDPAEVLRSLVRSLKPGGYLKLSTPGDREFATKLRKAREGACDAAQWRREFDVLAPLVHVNLFDRHSLLALGAKTGLQPFRLPLRIGYAGMVLFHSTRQLNRNLVNPWKRWRATGTWQYFRNAAG